jgi:hypothetical protein
MSLFEVETMSVVSYDRVVYEADRHVVPVKTGRTDRSRPARGAA